MNKENESVLRKIEHFFLTLYKTEENEFLKRVKSYPDIEQMSLLDIQMAIFILPQTMQRAEDLAGVYNMLNKEKDKNYWDSKYEAIEEMYLKLKKREEQFLLDMFQREVIVSLTDGGDDQ